MIKIKRMIDGQWGKVPIQTIEVQITETGTFIIKMILEASASSGIALTHKDQAGVTHSKP